jgi:hypothetical protein
VSTIERLGLAIVLVLGVSGCAAERNGTAVAVHGLQKRMSVGALTDASDVVVLAVARDATSSSFEDNRRINAQGRAEPRYKGSRFEAVEIRVLETLKGERLTSLSVARLTSLSTWAGHQAGTSGDQDIKLTPGKKYLLFLSRGTLLWEGHYLVLGPQGLGEVVGNEVRFRDGRAMPVDAVVAEVSAATR